MTEDLEGLIGEIREDLSDDFIATEIVGKDGMSIAEQKARSKFKTGAVAALFAETMRFAQKMSEELDKGELRENQVQTEHAIIFTRFLGDSPFYWLLVVSRSATLGMVRLLMDEYEDRLWAAIPS